MLELKKRYNDLLANYQKGADLLSKDPENQDIISKLQDVQLKMNECLMKIGEYTVEETEHGFDLTVKEDVIDIEKRKNEKNELIVSYEVNNEEITLTPQIVQDYLVGTSAKITIPEFKLFAELCKARKLNPFLKEAYCIKYSNNLPATIVVGKDAVLKRAVLNPNYNGIKSGIIVLDSNGNITERKGTFKLSCETLVGGWAEVFRKDWQNSVYCSVSLDEVIQKKSNGQPNSNWEKQPATMIEKVAKVRALREAFVEDLGGMYEAEEMNIELSNNMNYVEQSREVQDVL